MTIVDAFAHALPAGLREAVVGGSGHGGRELENWRSLTTLFDLPARLAIMDEHGIDMQVVTTPSPPLESFLDDQATMRMAALANDAMAEMVSQRPDRFRGVATVPLLDVGWAVEELHRSATELGLLGALMYTSVRGRPLDASSLDPFYAAAEALDVPLWMHPERPESWPDYRDEEGSRYGSFLVLGWPYETAVAMSRLVFGGVLARHRRLQVIAHHAGGVVPFLWKRMELHYASGERIPRIDVDGGSSVALESFRRFHVDTVTGGSVSALMNAYELFGPHRMLFATDMPFGPRAGATFAEVAVDSLRWMPIPPEEREAIAWRNVASLTRVDVEPRHRPR